MNTKIKIIYLLPFILFLSILLIFFLKFEKVNKNIINDVIKSPLIGKEIPNLNILKIKKNKTINFSKYKNKIFAINFFASWCLPCKVEAPLLNTLSNKIDIIGISYKDDKTEMIEFLERYGNPYSEIGIDKKGSIAIEWGVYGIPETFVVNTKGVIKYRHIGPITKKVYKKINLLIKEIK